MKVPSHSIEARRRALRDAARWHAELGDVENAVALEGWACWHRADPVNQWAWRRVEALQQTLSSVPGPLSAAALGRAPDQGRRAVLASVVAFAGAGVLGYAHIPWDAVRADHRTGVGERRVWTLADGSHLVLDTDTAVSVHFSERERRLRLHRGALMLTSAADPAPVARPLLVETGHGWVNALGTRFSVRHDERSSRVAVFESAVDVQPRDLSVTPMRLDAGRMLTFDTASFGAHGLSDERMAAWVEGRLVIHDWRLDALVAELARYRSGRLHCDPSVGGLSISGAFPLDDSDAALAAIERALPVRQARRGRYWVSVVPA